jgi:hypothetical protein
MPVEGLKEINSVRQIYLRGIPGSIVCYLGLGFSPIGAGNHIYTLVFHAAEHISVQQCQISHYLSVDQEQDGLRTTAQGRVKITPIFCRDHVTIPSQQISALRQDSHHTLCDFLGKGPPHTELSLNDELSRQRPQLF